MNIDQYSNNLSTIVNKIRPATGRPSPEIIIGMDHNINLLNSATHPPTHNFMEKLSNLNLYPTITRPTRITQHSATLIDNIFISELLHRNFESSILIEHISDHLPLLTMLKQTRLLNSELLEFNSRCLNDKKLKHVAKNLFPLVRVVVGRLLVFLLCPRCALVLGNGSERLCTSRPLLGSYIHQESI